MSSINLVSPSWHGNVGVVRVIRPEYMPALFPVLVPYLRQLADARKRHEHEFAAALAGEDIALRPLPHDDMG